MFESSVELTPEQIEWLDGCTRGTWQLNPTTGEVDVDGGFNCNMQGLSDFKGIRFGMVGRDFHCSDNELITLEGAPQRVEGSFYCDYNQLITLEGAPREVKVDFDCGNNQLTSLEGAPLEVGMGFHCRDNQLTTLEGAPQKVGGYFNCDHNPVSQETLSAIFRLMKAGKSYLKAVEPLWPRIPPEDQTLLYRPEFEWIGEDERRKLDALRAYQGFKGMI